jgi:hypothetical protein
VVVVDTRRGGAAHQEGPGAWCLALRQAAPRASNASGSPLNPHIQRDTRCWETKIPLIYRSFPHNFLPLNCHFNQS